MSILVVVKSEDAILVGVAGLDRGSVTAESIVAIYAPDGSSGGQCLIGPVGAFKADPAAHLRAKGVKVSNSMQVAVEVEPIATERFVIATRNAGSGSLEVCFGEPKDPTKRMITGSGAGAVGTTPTIPASVQTALSGSSKLKTEDAEQYVRSILDASAGGRPRWLITLDSLHLDIVPAVKGPQTGWLP